MAIAQGKVTVKVETTDNSTFNISLGDIDTDIVSNVYNDADSATQKAAATLIDNFARAAVNVTTGTFSDTTVTATISTNVILAE